MVEIKKIRKRYGLSLERTAELAGLSATTLYNIESGARKSMKYSTYYSIHIGVKLHVFRPTSFNVYWDGQILYEKRKLMGLKQAELAKILGTTAKRVSIWESGGVEPSCEMVHAMAKLFDIVEAEFYHAYFYNVDVDEIELAIKGEADMMYGKEMFGKTIEERREGADYVRRYRNTVANYKAKGQFGYTPVTVKVG